MSETGEPPSFDQDTEPLFREKDRDSMSSKFDLWSYDDVARLSDTIPGKCVTARCPATALGRTGESALFRDWIAAGKPA